MISKLFLSFVPLVGTSLGSLLGAVSKSKKLKEPEELLVAVATGILGAISFNLFFETLSSFRSNCYLTILGLVSGFLFTFLVDFFQEESISIKEKLLIAMLIHNVPEGILIGIALADESLIGAYALITSISLQNIPDGIVVSMPLVSSKGKARAFWMGAMSGVVEPIAAILIVLSSQQFIRVVEPFLIGFSFSAIIMICWELLKETKNILLVVFVTIATMIFNGVLS